MGVPAASFRIACAALAAMAAAAAGPAAAVVLAPAAVAADVAADGSSLSGEEGRPEGERRGPHPMDLANRTVVQRIGTDVKEPESQKLVQLDVVRVENIRRLPLSFEVRYEDGSGQRTWLGSFALFPPDNPGRFVVATGGRLRRGGAIVVTLVVLQETRPEDRVRVTLDRISFRKGV